MSKDATDNISANPGKILRAAREEQKLSIDQVAHHLHLRSSVVQSIENEDYDSFSSDVFLKGYYRSYCRLVNLHEERMVELLDSQLCLRKKEIENETLNALKAKKSKIRKKMVGVTSALAFVGGLSFYVLVYLLPVGEKQTQIVESDTIQPAPIEQPVIEVAATKSSEPLVDDLTVEEPKKIQLETKDVQQKASVKTVQTMNAAETLAKEKMLLNTNALPENLEEVKAEVSQEPVVVDNKPIFKMASFEAVFTGDCWFKFTNAQGKTVFAALKRAGNKVNYTGPAPFSIVFGDANKVNVTFDGDKVDLKPYTARNGRAQIKLEPSS